MQYTNFGLDPESQYYFEVSIDKSGATIVEWYDRPRNVAFIPVTIWQDICNPIKAHWNERLQKHGQKSGRWSKVTRLDRLFGKELTLLAWVLEDAPADLVGGVYLNWRGLAPEERWWLFTTANATSNRPDFGKDRGWRKALRIAFTENAAMDLA